MSSAAPIDPESGSATCPPEERVPTSVVFAYGVPMAAISLAFTPFGMYYMKYGIEVLLIPPAAIGAIQFIARLWDAVSDPLVGAWSDRTQTRWGRRRPWLVLSAIPMAVTYVSLWAPPAQLEGTALLLWLLFAYLIYETASTGVFVPYFALGMELSEGHHDRTRVFAWRTFLASVGTVGGFASLYWLREASDPRATALLVASIGGAVLAAAVIFAAVRVPERPNYQTKKKTSVVRAMRDVFANPHARVYFAVVGVEAFGVAILPQMVVFILDDVIQDEYVLYWILGLYAVPQFALIPLWARLSVRFGKKPLWLFGMACSALGFTGSLFLTAGAIPTLAAATLLCGVGLGIGTVLGPSVAADVVDYDEVLTGERREGSFTAVLNFIRKAGLASAAMLAGFGLQFSGYDASAEVQSPGVQRTILWLAGGIPALCYVGGIVLFRHFRLDGPEHARVQLEMRQHRAERHEAEASRAIRARGSEETNE